MKNNKWLHGVMVSTHNSESWELSSNPGET